MKNKKKFKNLILIVTLVVFIVIILINKSLSHTEISYRTISISNGDTLWSISKYERENNTYFENKDIRDIIEEIKFVNNLQNSNINVGDVLKIPTV